MPNRKYPGADIRQWLQREHGGVRMERLRKVVLHSTESESWPSYPDFAPTFTIDVFDRKIRQHMDVDISATTLADPDRTPVRENRDGVVQVEIVMYCDDKRTGQRKHVSKMGDAEYAYLGRFLQWLNEEWGVPLVSTVKWVDYPDSYGERAAQRLTSRQYDAYEGILGHQHVSGNNHGDPGRLDIKKLIRMAKPAPRPIPIPQPQEVSKGPFDMSAAKSIFSTRNRDIDFAEPDQRQLALDDEGAVSILVGESEGVDVLGSVAFQTKDGLPTQVKVWWVIVEVASGKEDKIIHERLGVTSEAASGHLQTTFKGSVHRGPNARLRLFFRASSPTTVTAVQVSGWKM